ncbi:Cyclin-dependent kinase inhibitor 3 (CDKN3) [Octadecabacter temperatus]|uniref:protein-tyrosine-phosphatase n=1 Tax=Octadecabacter temperatus TaxID=1458307 RepID=A0A0K0Y8R2_9RHOB|nr:protein-tyrosine phosphatase family protein [Octadecabacter temperatus]AKS47359.1 Cyclin-dependent kinase inhibitor 3 (CDKN3) [Octadecabacter temperatus]SIO43558.1 Cyclin-dependent kinase inhibitor 3 (CDKN3) [Octadecabacter temperatus]
MGSSKFAIYPLEVGAGQVALSPIPGRSGAYETDLSAVLHWAPDLVLTMTTQSELDRMGATNFGDDLAAVGIQWRHLPIVDFGAPDNHIKAMWGEVSRGSADVLANSGKILIHCFGGCGRSGMVALRLMVEAGEAPDLALKRLRQTRPCAVETEDQQEWAANPSV